MKNIIKGIIIGVISTTLLLGTVAAATNLQKIEVLFNNIIIKVNGSQVANKNEGYKLANGNEVPFSIVYKDTTYLPLRKVAELVGKDVGYDPVSQTASINDKAGNNFRPISVVINEVTYDTKGNAEVKFNAHNFTNKDIVSFEANVYCYDKDVVAVLVDGNNVVFGECKDTIPANGDLTNQAWVLEGFNGAEIFGLEVIKVNFKDGTTWDNSVLK